MQPRLLKNTEIDRSKWDLCIQHSQRSDIYALSWYLDIECPTWKGLVFGDYEAVFPLPHRKRYKLLNALVGGYLTKDYLLYVSNPHLQIVHSHIVKVLKKYPIVSISTLGLDLEAVPGRHLSTKKRHVLDFKSPNKYPIRRLRESLKIAERAGFDIHHGIGKSETVEFIRRHLHTRKYLAANILYDSLYRLIDYAQTYGIGQCWGIYREGALSAVVFYMVYNRTLYFIQNAGDPASRKMAGMHKLFYNIIEAHRKDIDSVNFLGSNNEKIGLFLRNFSNQEVLYTHIRKRLY